MNMTTDTTIKTGVIVLPQGGTDELIVGIVTDDNHAQGMVDVVWISDQRGIFYCWEAASDLTIASLSERDEMADIKLDHAYVARMLELAPKS